ncbi:VWA domain-containing protein, partial [bacterium]|nr:VWA domain-containing protein [bacterium]
MGGFFLYPLILAGAALIAIPWLVHQIRRPERDIKPFSSLMFVPKIKRKVIERRSIQHILLMLLRMALVILLVLAFARPYRLFSIAPSAAAGQAADHVILLDTSFSMGAGSNFEEAKNQALQIVNGLESNERAVLIPFHQTADISHTFVDRETASQNKQRIRQVIRQAKLTQQTTNYYSALDAAREVLTPKSQEQIKKERHIHLITDFQQKGFSTQQPFHKLPSAYQLHCLPIGTKAQNRFAITGIHLQKQGENHFRVLAQIKNGVDTQAQADTALFINGKETASKTISIEPGFTNKIDLDFQIAEGTPFQGYLQVEQDALELDNRRYFAWNPIPKKQIQLIADNTSLQPGEPAWFVEQALHIRDTEWHVETISPPRINDALS